MRMPGKARRDALHHLWECLPPYSARHSHEAKEASERGVEGIGIIVTKPMGSIRAVCAENRPKSIAEIWNHRNNVVTLYRQSGKTQRGRRRPGVVRSKQNLIP